MQKIPLEAAQEDMVLAKAVTRENGVVLIAAGTLLTSSLIYRLENMGVEHIVVEGNPLAPTQGAEALAQKREHLDYLFRNFQDNQYMQRAKKIIDDYYAQGSLGAPSPSQLKETNHE